MPLMDGVELLWPGHDEPRDPHPPQRRPRPRQPPPGHPRDPRAAAGVPLRYAGVGASLACYHL
jgi:hypothetical protein